MIRRPPRSTLFPTRRSSDLRLNGFLTELRLRRVELLLKSVSHDQLDESPMGRRSRIGSADDPWATHRVDRGTDRKSTRLNSSHQIISYAVFCFKKKKTNTTP